MVSSYTARIVYDETRGRKPYKLSSLLSDPINSMFALERQFERQMADQL